MVQGEEVLLLEICIVLTLQFVSLFSGLEMIEPITPGLWQASHEHFPNGMHWSCRCTLIEVLPGELLTYSPVPFSEQDVMNIENIGKVQWIVAPNAFHHLWVRHAQRKFVEARTYLATGIAAKQPELEYEGVLPAKVPDTWRNTLELAHIDGNNFNEVVLFHKSTHSLIVADLVFNIHEPKGWVAPLVLRMTGTYKKLAQSKLWRFATHDRDAACASIEKILDWPFERIIMGHGRIVEDDARRKLAAALFWMRRAKISVTTAT